MGVASVVRDYIEEMPATLGQDLESQQQKVGLCTNIPVLLRSIEAVFFLHNLTRPALHFGKIYDSLWMHRKNVAVSQQKSNFPKCYRAQKANYEPGGIAGWEPLGGWL